MTTKPKTGNESAGPQKQAEGGKKSPVSTADGGQSSSATSDDITNQENRPLNGGGERAKKTSRKKWVPMAIDVRTSRGGRKDRTSSGGGPGAAARPAGAGGGRTRNRDSISKEPGTASVPASESWRGDTERRATSFGKNPRGPRPATAAAPGVGPVGGAAAPVTANGVPGYRRPHPGGRRVPGGPGGAGFKKGEPGRMVNGKMEGGAPLTELKNGAPLYYVPSSYRADPLAYLKECIRHQM